VGRWQCALEEVVAGQEAQGERTMFGGIYKGRRVLVTGHTGFKGSWLSHWLLELGADVAGFSLYLPSTPCNFEVLGLERRLRHIVGDIRDAAAVQAAFDEFRPEIVFHLAAQAIVRTSYDEPKLTFDTNLGGTVNVLEAVRATPSVRTAVFITSDKCYENVEWEFGYRETDRLGGKDPYSASKACAEIAISAYARSFIDASGKRIASTRAGNVIGGGDWAKDRIVPDCARAWAAENSPVIRSPGATRPWQHVLEPLSGYLWLAACMESGREGLAGEAFNFGPRAEVNQPVSRLIDEMGKTWAGRGWLPDPAGVGAKAEAGLLKLCCDKALQRLGWQAVMSFAETVAMTAEWYRAFYDGGMDMRGLTSRQLETYARLGAQRGAQWPE
jgi:CDP-glucose 4,6-dehydratase